MDMMRKSLKCLVLVTFAMFTSGIHAQHAQVQDALTKFSNDSLETFVKRLTGILPIEGTDTIRNRQADTEGNDQAFRFIKKCTLSWGLKVDSQVFSFKGRNLIATKKGHVSDRFLLLGAHYDAVGENGQPRPFTVYPGADDNASGTAATMEAARILSQYDWPFTIKFAFWDEEESGLVGSRAYCRPDDVELFMGYINLDMIAYDGDNDSVFEIHTSEIAYSRLLAQRVISTLQAYQIPLKHKLVDPGDPATDHKSFWNTGMTAVGINEIYRGPDANPNWHMFRDSITRFNLPYFWSMTKLAVASIADCAMDTVSVLGIDDRGAIGAVQVYPNPASEWLNIETNIRSGWDLKLIDIQGRTLHSDRITASNHVLNLAGFNPGFYLLQISSGEGNRTIKILHTQ